MRYCQKQMNLQQSIDFEERFAAKWIAEDRPRHVGLFMRSEGTGPVTYFMLVVGGSKQAEELSHGGWQDAQQEQHRHKWGWVVGDDAVAAQYGVTER